MTAIPRLQRNAVHPVYGHRSSAIELIERRPPIASWRDLVATRASSAWRLAESGLLEQVGSNVVRLQKLAGTKITGVVVEGARTNLVSGPTTIGGAGWTANCLVTANATTAPDGTATADLLTAAGISPGGDGNAAQAIGGTGRVASVYAKRATTGSHASLMLGTGVEEENFSPPVGRWQRFSFYNAGTCTTLGIYVCTDADDGTLVGGEDGYFWGAQVEAARFPSSFCVGARVADVIRLPPRFAPPRLYDEPFQLLVQPFFASDEVDGEVHTIIASGDHVGPGLWRLHMAGDSGSVGLGIDVTGSLVTGSITFSRDQVLRVRVDPRAGIISVRGATSGDGDYEIGAWSARHPFMQGLADTAGTRVQVGHQDGETDHFFGVISELYRADYADGWDLYEHMT